MNFNVIFLVTVAITIGGFIFYQSIKKTGDKNQKLIGVLVILAGILLSIVQCFTIIPAGHVGVVDFMGKVESTTKKAGLNVVNPLAGVVKFSIKTQELMEIMNVPSKEGLTVELDISLLFKLNEDKANLIYRTVGANYTEIVLMPQFRSVVRGVTAKYEAKALYTASRETLEAEIVQALQNQVGPRGITIERAALRSISLPPKLKDAIELKLQAEQEAQRMSFVLDKERLEADRKRIEAQGIADFQNIVAKGISENLLRWKGIEATEKLANSNNSKVVVIGSGKDGLPLILGN
ncbi:MAG: prohibitin family protein [Ignavibacteriales bacterium]|nr:prohibitin family protein [Ignavibacteriales bacterium]